MQIQILNAFSGDDQSEIETVTDDGRAQAARLVSELLRSGSAVFLEKEVNGQNYTYRVVGYDPKTNKLTIRLDGGASDVAIERHPVRRKGPYKRQQGVVSAEGGRVVAVAPRSGG